MKSIPELMLTVVSLSSSDTVTYLAFELRPNVIRAAFQAMEAYGLKAEEVNFCKACLGLGCHDGALPYSARQTLLLCLTFAHLQAMLSICAQACFRI